MIGLLYILLSFFLGWAICCYAFPKLRHIVESDGPKRKIDISPYILLLPVWYVTGTLALTWSTYWLAYLFRGTAEPLFYANLITMPLALLVSVYTLYRNRLLLIEGLPFLSKNKRSVMVELILLSSVTILAFVLMWMTFFVKGENLYVGVSVFSDFSPHIGMIRSFSYGNNFPTTYPHFAGEDIKYHFMFQFLVGNLEYLGLRIDYAFNLPSILSFMSAFLLLYVLAVKITGKLGAGVLACLFFAFRSSKTLFLYLANLPKGNNIWKALTENTDFISSTPNEDWGLWNLNVYCNQRHLAFGLSIVFFLLILFLPHLYDMFEDVKEYHWRTQEHKRKSEKKSFLKVLAGGFRIIFLSKHGWEIKDLRLSISAGLLLGALSFFHGAAVIGVLTILFIMAVVSRRRLEYAIMAIITVSLSMLQTKFFIHGSVVSTQFLFGFIAENKTLFGVISYLERLLGILPLVLLVALCLEKRVNRYLLIAFTAPLVFAFTISLTVDVTVNHKYIMISCILLGIFAAAVIMRIFERREWMSGILGVLLIVMLTATGIYDFVTILRKNVPDTAIVLDLNSDLTAWINENSTSQDIFLTSNYSINQVVLGGAMLYEGWPYFPWSAGYDTDYRTAEVKKMYEANTPTELRELVGNNNIRFIIVDHDNRTSEDYIVNEANIRSTYEAVYSIGEDDWQTTIYDTLRPLQ